MMKKTIKAIVILSVFITLATNLTVTNGTNSILISQSFKSLLLTALAEGEGGEEACVITNFATDAVLSSDFLLCFNECAEVCGIERCCIMEEGGGPCTETICN
jgi:hypothetical protein